MTAKPLIFEGSPDLSHVVVHLELLRFGHPRQRVNATLLHLTRENAEIRTSQKLPVGQQLWLVLELGDHECWTTRRWLAQISSSSISPHGSVALMQFSQTDLAPRLSRHVLRTDGRTKSYRFDKSWHSDAAGHGAESRTAK